MVAKTSVLLSSRSESTSRSRSNSDSSTNTTFFSEQVEEASEEHFQIVIVNDDSECNNNNTEFSQLQAPLNNDGTVLGEYVFDKETGLEVEVSTK